MTLTMPRKALSFLIFYFAGMAICAGADWVEINDLNQIAAMRQTLSQPDFTFKTITIVRMVADDGRRYDATSVGPTVVGFQEGGPPAARTLFTLQRKPERMVLFTQDVKNWKAFHQEIALAELTPGRAFRFPVVQLTGELLEENFTVREVIIR